MTKGFTERDPSEWVALDRNELNLFDNTREEEKTIHDGDGIDITMKKDGSIFVSGKYTLEGEKVVELGIVTLDAGTYTFSSGYKKTSLGTMYLKMDFGGRTVTADFTGHNKITVDAETTATVSLVIKADQNIYATLYPMICEGTETVSFYE